MVGKVLRQRYTEFAGIFAVVLGFMIIGIIALAFVLNLDSKATSFEISTLLVYMMGTMMIILAGSMSFAHNFNIAVGMGAARKSYVLAYTIVSLVEMFALYIFTILVHFLEKIEIELLYPMVEKEAGIEKLLFSSYAILILFAAVALQLLMGAVTLKFGRKGFIIVWVSYMLITFGFSRICTFLTENPDNIIAKMARTAIANIVQAKDITVLAGIILSAVLIFLAFILTRKQQVTNL